jgi:biotin transport system substrate-specific component
VWLAVVVGSIGVIHPLGIVGMKLHQDVSWATAASWDVPFYLGDVVKTLIVAVIAAEVHRAFPKLLARS